MRRFLLLLLLSVSTLAFADASRPLLVLGDSLSAAHNIPAASGWVSLLDQRLAARQPPRAVINASISGETSAGGLARLPALLKAHQPAWVLLELGANDGLRGLPLAEARGNLGRIIELCLAADARVLLIGIELPVNYGAPYRSGFRAMYRDLSAQFKQPLVPFLLAGVALDPALMQDDGLHPTAKAQPQLLETVWSVLGPLLDQTDQAPRKARAQ